MGRVQPQLAVSGFSFRLYLIKSLTLSSGTLSGIDTTQHTTTFTGLKFVPNEFAAVAGGDVDVDAAWASLGTYCKKKNRICDVKVMLMCAQMIAF